jgi:CheY-like chemotaxis protein
MTRVLVVQRDPVVAEQMAASLRGAGYETELCGGPQREPCPVIADMPCPLVDRADVLVYDAWVAGNAFGGHELVTALREVYVDLPVVLTSVDQSVGWAERDGPHRVIPLGSRPSDTELIEAIEVALGDQGMAVWPRRSGPRTGWPVPRPPRTFGAAEHDDIAPVRARILEVFECPPPVCGPRT